MAVLPPQVRYEEVNGPSSVAVRGPSLTDAVENVSVSICLALPGLDNQAAKGVAFSSRDGASSSGCWTFRPVHEHRDKDVRHRIKIPRAQT